MANVLFISETFLKQNTQVSDNVDVKYIRESILWAQDTEIQTVLGSTLYNYFKTELAIDNTGGTLPAAYSTLLDDYIQVTLKHYVTAECLAMAHYKITNKGLQIQDSEQSAPASTSSVNFLVEKETNKAEWYKQRLINYLCEYSSSFTEYTNPDDGVDVIHPDRNNFRTTIYLGGSVSPKSLREKYRDV
jgi:hypothetical protein